MERELEEAGRALRPLSRADLGGGERERKQGRKSLKFQF